MTYTSVYPATGELHARFDALDAGEALRILERSAGAFASWRRRSPGERARGLEPLAAALRGRAGDYARLITLEMGKPIVEARAEIEKCAALADAYARLAPAWLEDELVDAGGREHRVAFEPLGVILSIMPWNFPFWQAMRFAVPALLAGNASLLKPARNTPRCALALAEVFLAAGFPEGLLQALLADHDTVARLIADERVRGVSFTGGTEAGASIASLAGRHLKKAVLELGGSDPFIVLADADADFAAEGAVRGRMVNTGQSCIAAKRFILRREIAGPFTARFVERMAALRVGDPLAETTQVGPLVGEEAAREIEEQLAEAVARGARVLTGGARPRPGPFFAPTVVGGVDSDMRIWREEVFGPIAPLLVVDTDEEAIALANASAFGLGASLWTRDEARGLELSRSIEAGTVFVNSVVQSDPRMPFGGVKRSGLGRELSRYGLLEFCNIKGISVYGHGA
ncbi:MAG: NAD-dependent succinate-semialdehyde dehydrogenase [Candidatus Eisenbacteria bacterium]|uniref:NAD-dependent succinate-semialdehyde dehydrogenase n=1 Tax=Eiseniibacteriota bacterium TaxID=2212470 RepID=A0A937XBA4_UNCEI|nr:NAD-dependent succinate-semialdehyde dehydrogenase [Candidatus Eisenbacteria bacterium]